MILGSTSSENRHSGLINKRLRPKNLPVWLNLARFINKSGNIKVIENMHLRATFDVFLKHSSAQKRLLRQYRGSGYG